MDLLDRLLVKLHRGGHKVWNLKAKDLCLEKEWGISLPQGSACPSSDALPNQIYPMLPPYALILDLLFATRSCCSAP